MCLEDSELISFSGRFGPIDCTVSFQDLIYVARFEFKQFSGEGLISVVTPQGKIKQNITLAGKPEISGLQFSL